MLGAWWHRVTNTNIVHCNGDFKSKVTLHAEAHVSETFEAAFVDEGSRSNDTDVHRNDLARHPSGKKLSKII
jgi:hypothetical protein